MLATIGFLTAVAEIGWNALNRGRPGRRKWRDHCITYMAITAFLPPLDRTLTPWISHSICVWPFIVGWFPKWHLDSPPAFNARCISDTILSFLFAKIVLKSIFLSYKRLMWINKNTTLLKCTQVKMNYYINELLYKDIQRYK